MENDSQDKIDQDKVDEIRKPSQRGLTEPEKWATLYRLIFDLDADAETPSPCKLAFHILTPLINARL
jgi:hypothetical protein